MSLKWRRESRFIGAACGHLSSGIYDLLYKYSYSNLIISLALALSYKIQSTSKNTLINRSLIYFVPTVE